MEEKNIGKQFAQVALALALLCVGGPSAKAVDGIKGVTLAVSLKAGIPPVIDGQLDDWDLSYMEPAYGTEQTAREKHIEWAVMYGSDALFVAARVGLPNRAYRNTFSPQDAFWWDDILQFRLCTDPTVAYPIDRDQNKLNNRVCHVSVWRNTEAGKNFVHIDHGTFIDLGADVNPVGVEAAFRMEGDTAYQVEIRLPWRTLNVPDGKNPFTVGQRMPFVIEPRWYDGGNFTANYRANPGDFSFQSPQTWGQVQFVDSSPHVRSRPTMAQIVDSLEKKQETPAPVGVPIEIQVPKDGLELSVNILDAEGHVVRELTGGEVCKQGTKRVYWDGYDAWQHPVPLGTYRWGAYLHEGLKAVYEGSVGVSGHPSYNTADGKGGWGGDHSNPVDCAADPTGLYFLWPVAEGGRAVVKTDDTGKVIWRKTPFLGGGFGEYFSIASDGEYVYLSRTDVATAADLQLPEQHTYLAKLDAATGALLTWPGGEAELLVHTAIIDSMPHTDVPLSMEHGGRPQKEGYVYFPDCMGIAVYDHWVYLANYASGAITIRDGRSGKSVGALDCPGVRGLNFGRSGTLYAVSFPRGKRPAVWSFEKGQTKGKVVVADGLEAPFDVAVTQEGQIFVSDLGTSQQVKIFNRNGTYRGAIGKKGGRPYQGAYDAARLLNPSGLSIDPAGYLLVTETSAPKVFSRFDTQSKQLVNRWFGAGVYWNSTWPMPEDPKHVFYMLTGAVGRGEVRDTTQGGVPDAYWDLHNTPYRFVGDLEGGIPQPETIRAENGKLYLVKDTDPHAVMLLENDQLRPVSVWTWSRDKRGISGWIDRNRDGQMQEPERFLITHMADGNPVPKVAEKTSSFHMEPNGDLYFMTEQNAILKIPAAHLGSDGTIDWKVSEISCAVDEVLPGQKELSTTWRQGLLGVRVDNAGNLYTLFNTRVPGDGRPYGFPSEAIATEMLEGLGHTSEFNAVKFAKFDRQGKLLWMAGRKATAGAKPGEMYHFWNMAGLLNDTYIAGGSEWGQLYVYTHDGFFVDALMNDPGRANPPGPYTFGGETSGGRMQYFAATDELWAYSSGMAYRVAGFKNGSVVGEQRIWGEVTLDRIYTSDTLAKADRRLYIQHIASNPMADPSLWGQVPVSELQQNGKKMAGAALAQDGKNLYVRMDVTDDSPLQNAADQVELLFKGGDMAGVMLGPSVRDTGVVEGDIRIMAALYQGTPRLIAMKPKSTRSKRPFDYYTPASGTVPFDYVGDIPDSKVELQKTADGYRATFSVPLSFLDFPIQRGAIGDIDLRFSGIGGRGLQTVSRNYFFTPQRSKTTMTDDVPTEASLYPEYWGALITDPTENGEQ